MTEMQENLLDIKENIEKAAAVSGRKSQDITLIGVTKTVDVDRIKELMSYGIVDIGENKVQELLEKYEPLEKAKVDRLNWHLIGHLQTNKVKAIMDKVTLIHSVDSLKLAEEINKRAETLGRTMDILVEVNIAGETSKDGVAVADLSSFFEKICCFTHLKVKGLMTVAPFVANPENNREYFHKMTKLFVDISSNFRDNTNMEYLSMGMTNDYSVAIEEGANMVRIGTGIFGHRNYKKI